MSPARPVKVKQQFDTSQVQPSQLKKKAAGNLFKKKIEDLKAPDLIIKVSYKGKRIAIPIAHCDEKGLNEVVMPHIIRFEKEILST